MYHGSSEEDREEINKKVLGTRSERVKSKLRKMYAEKKTEVKKSIRADKRKWVYSTADEAHEDAIWTDQDTL